MKSLAFTCALILAATAFSAPLKVRVMPVDARKAYLMPHWENWQWSANTSTMKFGDLTISLSGGSSKLIDATRKALLETGMHMGTAGIASADGKSGGQLIL